MTMNIVVPVIFLVALIGMGAILLWIGYHICINGGRL